MPDRARGILRIQGWGGVSVEHTQRFLSNLERCYDSIYVYDSMLRSFIEHRRYFWAPHLYEVMRSPSNYQVHRLVPVGNHLLLRSVSLQSPGFWEFFGTLNPLEVIRVYLNDRHERRKDREYREEAENEKLNLENQLKKLEILQMEIDLLKEMGITEEEMVQLRSTLIHEPLDRLGSAQDRRLIESAEVTRLDDE